MNLSAKLEGGAAQLDLKGLILTPGVAPLAVNGKPARVRFSRDVIQAAYAKLKAKLAREGGIEMRLVHPDLHPLSIPFGRATSFRNDPSTGTVYLAGSHALPEVETLFDAQARDALQHMGLSMRAPCHLEQSTTLGIDYEAVELGELTTVDIVDQGAFDGSSIVHHLPDGLAARISAAHAKGSFTVTSQRAGNIAPANDKGTSLMPKIESVEQVPAEVRAMVPPDQLPAYVTAYNAAIEAGAEPLAAHEAALKAIAAPPTGQEGTMKDQELTAQLAAANTAKIELEKQAKELTAQLAAANTELAAAKSEKGSLEARVKAIEGDLSAAKQREEDRDAQADVDAVIREGVAPAMRDGLLSARKSMPRDAFVKLAASIPRTVPVGEKGRTGEHAGTGTDELSAARKSVQEIGVENVISSGLHMRDPHVALVLKNEHAGDPRVARISARLAPIAAKATSKAGDA